jgi:hypothetical protein
MSPTSPREIIPTPTRIDCSFENPHTRASSPDPSRFVTIATTTSAIVKPMYSPRRGRCLQPDADEEHWCEHRIRTRMDATVDLFLELSLGNEAEDEVHDDSQRHSANL